jgi:hypothetical protein
MSKNVQSHFADMSAGSRQAAQQMVSQTLNSLTLLDNQGVSKATTFSSSVMRVFNEMKNSGIQSLAELDSSALSYLSEIQGYVNAMNGQLNLAENNIAARTGGHNAPLIHAHATGTSFAPGGPSIVAEDGAELVVGPRFGNLPRGSQVIPNNMLQALMRSIGGMTRGFMSSLPSSSGSGFTTSYVPAMSQGNITVIVNVPPAEFNVDGYRLTSKLMPRIVQHIRSSTGVKI